MGLLIGLNGVQSGTSGSVATDTIWDAKGDIAAGTGADTASKLAVGNDGHLIVADSAASTGLRYAGPRGQLLASATQYHGPVTLAANGGDAFQSAATAQVAVWWPCYLHKQSVLDAIATYCSTLEAGSSVRVGVYNSSNLTPTSLIADYGTLSGATTGQKTATGTQAMNAGWFFLCVWASNHTTVRWSKGTFTDGPLGMTIAQGRRAGVWTASGVDYSAGLPANAPAVTIFESVTLANAIRADFRFT